MDVYDRVARIVGPKKLKLAGAEAELAIQMEKLNEKRAQLKEVKYLTTCTHCLNSLYCFYEFLIYVVFLNNTVVYFTQQVADKLQALNDNFDAMTQKKKELEDNIELCSQKLDRAEKLIGTQ